MNIIVKPITGSKQPACPDRQRSPPLKLTRDSPCGSGPDRPRQVRRRACPSASTPASTGLRDQTGWCWMRGFCHQESLARKAVTKPRPPCRPLTSGSRVSRTKMPTRGIAGTSTLCLAGETADVYAMSSYYKYHSRAHDGFEAARAYRSTAAHAGPALEARTR